MLSSIAFETVKSKKEEKQKSMILGQFFSFSNFSVFWEFRNILWCQLKQMFLINYQYFWNYTLFFYKNSIHYKRGSKHAVTIPLHQRHCLTCNYCCMKFYCPEARRSWVTGPKGVLFHVTKTRHYLKNIFNS